MKLVRQGLIDERLELIPCYREGDVGLVGQAAAASEQDDDMALPVEDDGARVPAVRHAADGFYSRVWHRRYGASRPPGTHNQPGQQRWDTWGHGRLAR